MSYSRDPNIPGLKHLHSTPYKLNATRLQTLNIWLPEPQSNSTPRTTKPIWIIYVHGGAWRDPTQDSLCFIPTLHSLLKNCRNLLDHGHIAGLASLNYRLSPYPNHSTDPSSPSDPDRNVIHPAHVKDVHAALEYLIGKCNIERWIGIGHSCGATLLLQLPLISTPSSHTRQTLQALILLAGIYDIPSFLKNHSPPYCPEDISAIYRQIVEGAFGQDPGEYESLSPARFGAEDMWGGYVVLGYSGEDQLVEPQQRGAMTERYLREGWVRREDAVAKEAKAKVVDIRDLTLGHDEVWEDGGQIAGLIAEVVRRLDEG